MSHYSDYYRNDQMEDMYLNQPSEEIRLKLLFPVGKHVRYVPYHAEGDARHADCENGVVSSVRGTTVFVRFGLGDTAQGCSADQLV